MGTRFKQEQRATTQALESLAARVHLDSPERALDDFRRIGLRAQECLARCGDVGRDEVYQWDALLDDIEHIAGEAIMWITEHIDDGTAYDDDGEATAAVCDTIERHLSEVETALG